MLLDGHRHPPDDRRVPCMIHPEVRDRLQALLLRNPELRGVGYSAFINRACEAAEGEIAERRSR